MQPKSEETPSHQVPIICLWYKQLMHLAKQLSDTVPLTTLIEHLFM